MSQSPQPASPSAEPSPAATGSIDASCRWPLLGLYYGAAGWLVVSAVAYLLASMSFHAPAMFADCAYSSYGRMAPLANNLLIYGFCIPAGWAACLWMLARLGKTRLVHGWFVIIGTKLWNLGVLLGAIGILIGDGSGYEFLEFPLYAAWPMLVASLLVGISGLNTLRARADVELHPAQWFAGLGVLWFPWIYITAMLLLQLWPVRGMAQGAVHAWFLAQQQVVLTGLFGVAALFYFLPTIKQQPLPSRQLALFTLITLICFGGWAGVPLTAPVPAWMSVLSRIMSVCLVVPVLALVLNVWPLHLRVQGDEARYFRFGFRALLCWMTLVLILNGTGVWRVAAFTLVHPGLFQLLMQGCGTMLLLGAAYYILPRIAGRPLVYPALARLHFAIAAAGVFLVVIPFVVGGFQQGTKLADAEVVFTDVAAATLMPIRVASMGQLLFIVGHLLLSVNVVALIWQVVRGMAKAFDNQPAALAGAEGRA
jgi:cytochrome c oxidase cbb3-type subunit 1